MNPSRLPRYAVHHWRTLLASLALITAGTHAHAQEPTARLVKDINRTPGVFSADIFWVMPVGTAKNVVFPQSTLALGHELYTSDGTTKGTRLLMDLLPGPDSDYLTDPLAFGTEGNAKVAFLADASRFSDSVWVTDGTEAGTVHVYESKWQQTNGGVIMRSSVPGGFFFEDYEWDQDSSRTLYFSDGTAAGTWPLNPLTGDTRERFSKPRAFITSGSVAYFIANDDEVWRCDGTPAGTLKVATVPNEAGPPNALAVAGSRIFIACGQFGLEPLQLWRCPTAGGDLTNISPPGITTSQWISLLNGSAIGDDIFFAIYETEDNSTTLWASDGFTTGTRRISLIQPGEPDERALYGDFTQWKGSIYFQARNPQDSSQELWRSDGTTAGTVRVKEIDLDFTLPSQRQPDTSEYLYLHVRSPDFGPKLLWQTKGDEASTTPVKNTPPCWDSSSDGPQFALAQSGLVFSANQDEPNAALYRVKGPNGGALQLTTPEKTTANSIPNYSELPYEMLGSNLLQIVEAGSGIEIWKMKPDGKGARSVWKAPGTLGQYPGYVGMQGTLAKTIVDKKGKAKVITTGTIFTLYDGEGHHEVWITNGTPASTKLLSQHETPIGLPLDFKKLDDIIYYSVPDEGATTRSLWKTDGTPAGTSRVLSFSGKSPGPDRGEMVEYNGSIFYLNTSANGRTTLWRTGGDVEGTVCPIGRWVGAAIEKASSLSVVGGKMYVSVLIDTEEALWESDGTVTGTNKTTPALTFKTGTVGPAYDLNGVAVFRAQAPGDPYPQWWRHSGTDTSRVRNNITTEQLPSAESRYQAQLGSKLLYTGITPDGGYELWVTDGTDAGTHLVKDINPGPGNSVPIYLTTYGNAVYFTAWDDEHGYRLWRSDGTEAGTVPAANFPPGTYDVARGPKPMAGKLYFQLARRDVGEELHYIDLPLE